MDDRSNSRRKVDVFGLAVPYRLTYAGLCDWAREPGLSADERRWREQMVREEQAWPPYFPVGHRRRYEKDLRFRAFLQRVLDQTGPVAG